MTASRSIWQNIQQYSWLVFAIACLVAALVFWAVTDSDALTEVEPQSKSEVQVQIQPEKVTAMTHLGALSDEVQPLDLSTRVVVSNEHAPEFRGTKFIKENQRQWTMEIFRSSDEAIVKNFLLNRADRKQFFYFRLSGEDQAEQYVLSYGVFSNDEEAKRRFNQLALQLPQTIQPKAQQLSVYAEFVNDLGADEMKSAANQLYAIQLKLAALPKIDETLLLGNRTQKTIAPEMARDPSTSVRTTVTQRDAEGKIVNVKRSQTELPRNEPSSAQNAEKLKESSDSSRREVSDPFN